MINNNSVLDILLQELEISGRETIPHTYNMRAI